MIGGPSIQPPKVAGHWGVADGRSRGGHQCQDDGAQLADDYGPDARNFHQPGPSEAVPGRSLGTVPGNGRGALENGLGEKKHVDEDRPPRLSRCLLFPEDPQLGGAWFIACFSWKLALHDLVVSVESARFLYAEEASKPLLDYTNRG